MTEVIYRTKSNDRLDQICQDHYGRVHGVVEAVLLANSGLANYGALLPAHLAITQPIIPVDRVKKTTSIWQ